MRVRAASRVHFSRKREKNRRFRALALKTFKFCPKFANPCKITGINRKFVIFDATDSKPDGYERDPHGAQFNREFSREFATTPKLRLARNPCFSRRR